MQSLPLDYLFIAETFSGQLIKQTPDDISSIDPTKSAFYDVIQSLPLKSFSLVGRGQIFKVDLVDGHMEINGNPIPSDKQPHEGSTITPIYYRETMQLQKHEYEKRFTDKILGLFYWDAHSKNMTPHEVYKIGWQARHKGKNQKFEMTIS